RHPRLQAPLRRSLRDRPPPICAHPRYPAPVPRVHVFVCDNARPEGGRPACGARGDDVAQALTEAVLRAGAGGRIAVTRCGGLGAQVSPTGGFAASVPLNLPPARGPLPIPLSVVYTGLTRAGASGAGWDIPVSYVAWQPRGRNRPMASADDGHTPPRLMLALD